MESTTKITTSLGKIKTDIKDILLSAGFNTGIALWILGIILVAIEIYFFHRIDSVTSWPVTQNGGTITDSYMEETTNSKTYSTLVVSRTYYDLAYRTRVSFSYTVNGKLYNSTKLSYYEPWNDNPIEAKDELDFYQKGTKVNIRINPKNPAEAYILNRPYDNYNTLIVGTILILIGLYVLFLPLI